MAKKRRKMGKRPEFLPTAFWLSPRGGVVPVLIHAEALMLMPDLFGLDRAPYGRDEVNEAMADVMQSGWIRARFLSPGDLSFQVWGADEESIGAIYNLLLEKSAGISNVIVETQGPKGYWTFTLREFFQKAFPSGWRMGGVEDNES